MSNSEVTLTSEYHLILTSINDGNKKDENSYALTALLFTPNDVATRIWQDIEEVRDVYNTVIQICLRGKYKITQPKMQ